MTFKGSHWTEWAWIKRKIERRFGAEIIRMIDSGLTPSHNDLLEIFERISKDVGDES